ncbi:MAG: hypothetical protein CMI31_09610 [Opitutae bacterium]|nr:hypothetical protein [Opitutae bacterium]|tara:strand:+ start:140 stop:664 length:525 start_codon:yes stop_codon:yes gene_type:complete
MRKLIAAMSVALLLAGCGDEKRGDAPRESNQSPIETIDLDDNETRNRIIAEAIDEDNLDAKGDCCDEILHVAGQETPYTGWVKSAYEDGGIFFLAQYKGGKENGSWVQWYRNGKKMEETSFKDGKILQILVWKPNGIKCPVTNVVNGNGVAVSYDPDGKEYLRSNYMKGEWVKE